MSTSTMTSKGQLTVPKDVRDALGLSAGTRVNFERNRDGDYVLSTTRRTVRDLAGSLSYDGAALTLDEMDEAIAAGASSEYE